MGRQSSGYSPQLLKCLSRFLLISHRGGFGGEVDLNKAGYASGPIMVGAIDGVGKIDQTLFPLF